MSNEQIKNHLEKLVEFLKPGPKDEEEEIFNNIGLFLIGREDQVEIQIDKNLKIDYSETHMYIDCETYIGIIRIDRIEEITEI